MAGKTVVVTGAATSIGQAVARRFAKTGASIVLADRDEEKGAAFAEQIVGEGAAASFVAADVASKLDTHNIIAEALEAFQKIDVLIHSGVRPAQKPFLETSDDDFEALVTAPLRGAFNINQAVAKQFVRQFDDGGEAEAAIVNIISVEATTASADRAAFAASQGGIQQLTKAVALSLSRNNVRANCVALGAVKGDLIKGFDIKSVRGTVPMERVGDPSEAADAAYFLASQEASYISGHTLVVDGGRMIRSGAPRL